MFESVRFPLKVSNLYSIFNYISFGIINDETVEGASSCLLKEFLKARECFKVNFFHYIMNIKDIFSFTSIKNYHKKYY